MSSIQNGLAGYHLSSGQLKDAARCLLEGIELDVREGQSASLGVKHVNLAAVYAQMGQLDSAIENLTCAQRLLPDTDGMIALNLGEVRHLQGRLSEALHHLEQAHARCLQAGARAVEPLSLVRLAELHRDLGNHDTALKLGEQALTRSHELANSLSESMAHQALGTLHERAGRPAVAFDHHRRALETAGDAHLIVKVAALVGLANAACGLDKDEARWLAEQALQIAHERSFRILEGCAHLALADIALAVADPAEAARRARLALAIHVETGHKPGETHARRTLARSETVTGTDGALR